MEDERPFLIPIQRGWTLLILPFLALLYFLFVVWLGATRTRIEGVPTEWLVLGGLAFFLVATLAQVPFMLRRRPPRPEPEPEPVRDAWQDEPPEPVAPTPLAADDERVTTDETQQGFRVLEYSAPAKSRNRGAVYAKAYVPVTKEHVLRVETLAAEPHDL